MCARSQEVDAVVERSPTRVQRWCNVGRRIERRLAAKVRRAVCHLKVSGLMLDMKAATGVTAGCSVSSGERKLKERPLRFARDRPQPSAVGFDDRAADR